MTEGSGSKRIQPWPFRLVIHIWIVLIPCPMTSASFSTETQVDESDQAKSSMTPRSTLAPWGMVSSLRTATGIGEKRRGFGADGVGSVRAMKGASGLIRWK
ncbi:MAG: hypothetical protein BGO49_20220 [Planctomycetales bacterium 71-10]|nr:MAG: hypothetical protein BGO49_20220 [Planctomycetales bacterium 71-10]